MDGKNRRVYKYRRNYWAFGKYFNEYHAWTSLVGGVAGKVLGVVEMSPNNPIEILVSRGQVWR